MRRCLSLLFVLIALGAAATVGAGMAPPVRVPMGHTLAKPTACPEPCAPCSTCDPCDCPWCPCCPECCSSGK